MSQPVLYTFGLSVWAAAAELAVAELGFATGAIEHKIVNLAEGDNFSPEFLHINPNGTLPTLTADGKAYTSTAEVIRYLVDHAPNKVPHGSDALITRIHDESVDPNFVLLATRNDEEFRAATTGFPLLFLKNRQAALETHSQSPEGAKFAEFYKNKIPTNGGLFAIYTGQVPSEVKESFYASSTKHWENVFAFILNELPGLLPETKFVDGDIPGETDYHLAAWLARIGVVCGGTPAADGYKALEKTLQAPVPAKVAAYWAAWTERPGWKQIYGERLR